MMPSADRIYEDPGRGAKKTPADTGNDYLAVLRIMQLNVEVVDQQPAKREI